MSSAELDQDVLQFRPFSTPNHKFPKVKRAKYSTSLDSRGYIPVYEYVINDHPIMWDRETGYVHFTGIWKALGNSKADIVKMVDSNPDLNVKKIRGGFLKIQGTWIPHEYAEILCKSTAYKIRKELMPIFGPKFPYMCLEPNALGFGCLQLPGFERPKNNRNANMPKLQIAQAGSLKLNNKLKHKRKVDETDDYGSERIVKSMSLSRLLNHDNVEKRHRANNRIGMVRTISSSSASDTDSYTGMSTDSGSDHDDSSSACSASTPTSPGSPFSFSPNFHIVPNDYVSDYHYRRPAHYASPQNEHPFHLPPLKPRPRYAYPAPLPTMHPRNQDQQEQELIETINASLLLRRLSQDDGRRPLKPFEEEIFPCVFNVGGKEFRLCFEGNN